MKLFYTKLAILMALNCQIANATPIEVEKEGGKRTLLCEEITVFKLSNQMVDFTFKTVEMKMTAEDGSNSYYGEYENVVGQLATSFTLEEDEDLLGLFQANYVHGPKGFGKVSSFGTLLKKSILISSDEELADMWSELTLGDSKTATAFMLTIPGTISPSAMVVLEKAYADVLVAYNKKYNTQIPVRNGMTLVDSISGLQIEGAASEILSQFKDGETLARGMNTVCIERH